MGPLSGELSVSNETTVPNARAFVRSLNVLFKYSRLYGLEHARSASQFDSAWSELKGAVEASGDVGVLLGASGSQLLLDGVPLETTPAERSFADLLNAAGVASIFFQSGVGRHEFANLVRVFMESGPRVAPLSERLELHFGKGNSGGIRINEIRFIAEDAGYSEARVAAQLAVRTLGADADRVQDWFRSPEKMIQLIAAAEGAHGGSGSGTGPGTGTGTGTGTGSGSAYDHGTGSGGAETGVVGGGAAMGGLSFGFGATAGSGSGGVAGTDAGLGPGAGGNLEPQPLDEGQMHSLLRLLAQFGEATHGKTSQQPLDAMMWQQRIADLPQNAQVTLRQALASVAAKTPSAKVDEAMLLRLAEDLAIRFALDRFQRGEVRVNAVRQMLDKMGHELETLRKLLKAREEKMSNAGISMESHADVLDRQFWAAVPDSGKRAVLTSSEAWCIPPRNVQQYVEELLGRGESEMAGDVLLKYASCVRNKDAEARKKAAIGLGQLAELYSKAASQRLQDALAQIGQQLVAEKDPELQTLLGAAFVRLSQEAAQRRYYRAMQQSLDSLADLEELRPTWAHSLRPRIGVENRLPEFVEEALTAEAMPEGLVAVLSRVPEGAGEHLAARLTRSGRRTERENIVQLAKAVGGACAQALEGNVQIRAAGEGRGGGRAAHAPRSRVDGRIAARCGCATAGAVFTMRLVRQLSIAGAPERGRLLANSLELLDVAAVSLALDEIGMCGDPATAAKMLRLAEGEILPQGADYLRVKAIEALGRMRAPDAVGPLRKFVEDAQGFRLDVSGRDSHGGRAGADENRSRMDAAVPAAIGAGCRVMALAPLDAIPSATWCGIAVTGESGCRAACRR